MLTTKIFRLFISSTFDDFKDERDLLQNEVFPEIDMFCKKKGYQFQPIDLRWGINSKSQIDQQTMNICLNEVMECSHYPNPNFLLLLGNRYGWVPLPHEINESLFEKIISFYKSNLNNYELLMTWYKLDRNRVKIIDGKIQSYYILQSRYCDNNKKENDQWFETNIENNLLELLQNAIKNLNIEKSIKEKYFLSATEQESQIGIFDATNKYAFAYIKDSSNSNISSEMKNFKDKIEMYLNKDNIIRDNFVEKVKISIKNSINAQINNINSIDSLKKEKSEHLKFLNDRIKLFRGREKELKQINKYIKYPNNKIFLISGISGIGKSAIIAKVIKNTTNQEIIYRFVGASVNSVNINLLLISIIDELVSKKFIKFDGNYEKEEYKFNEQISNLLKTINRRVSIFIDAIDQLSIKDDLEWLPNFIQNDISIIISTINDINYKEASSYFNQLLSCTTKNNILIVKEFNNEDCEQLLDVLLTDIGRSLSMNQRKYVLEKLNKNSSPLYMKFLIEIARYWNSDKTDIFLENSTEELIIQWIKSLYNLHNNEQKTIEIILGIIKASKDGLSEKELIDIVSNEKEILKIVENQFHGKLNKLPVSIWSRIHYYLKPFLIIKNVDNLNLIKFFHRQLDSAINKFCYEKNKIELHKKLANYFQSLNTYKRVGKNSYIPRSLNELPYHFINSNQFGKLEKCLCDLEFLGEIYNYDKHYDYKDILKKLINLNTINNQNIKSINNFIFDQEYLILRTYNSNHRYKTIFQLAYENGDDSYITQLAETMLENKKVDFAWLKIQNRKKKSINKGIINTIELNQKNLFMTKTTNYIVTYSYLDSIVNLYNFNGIKIKSIKLKAKKDFHVNKIIEFNGILLLSGSLLHISNGGYLFYFEINNIHNYSEVYPDVRGIINFDTNSILIWFKSIIKILNPVNNNLISEIKFIDNIAIYDIKILKNNLILVITEEIPFKEKKNKDILYIINYENKNILSKINIHNVATLLTYTRFGIHYEKDIILLDNNDILITSQINNSNCTTFFILDINLKIIAKLLILNNKKRNLLKSYQLTNGNIFITTYQFEWNYKKDVDYKLNMENLFFNKFKYSLKIKNDEILFIDNNFLYKYKDKKLIYKIDAGTTISRIIDNERYILFYTAFELTVINRDTGKKFFTFDVSENIQGIFTYNDYILCKTLTKIFILNPANNYIKNDLISHSDCIHSFQKFNDGYITCSSDNTIIIWDSNCIPLKQIKKHLAPVHGLLILDEKTFLSYSHDGTIKIWDKYGNEIYNFDKHKYPIRGVIQLKNKDIMSWSDNAIIKIWNIKRNEIKTIKTNHTIITCILELQNNLIMISSSDKIEILNQNGELKQVIDENNLRSIRQMKNGNILVFANGYISLYNSNLIKIKNIKIKNYNQFFFYFINGYFSLFDENNYYIYDDKGNLFKKYKGYQNTKKIVGNNLLARLNSNNICIWDYYKNQKKDILFLSEHFRAEVEDNAIIIVKKEIKKYSLYFGNMAYSFKKLSSRTNDYTFYSNTDILYSIY